MVARKLVRKFFQKNRAARQRLYQSSVAFQRRRFLKSIVQRSMVGSLTSNGKKLRAIKTFYSTIRYLRFVFDFQRPLQFIFNSISAFRPLFAVRLFRKGGTVHKVPAPISFKRSLLQVFGWFRRAVKDRKERYYHERFLGELNALLRFTGETYKHYKTYHSSALQNRTFMRRALTPYRPLKLRRRRRRKNYRLKFLRRQRRMDCSDSRLRFRYVRNRYHGLFMLFRQFFYYLFFSSNSKFPNFSESLHIKRLLYYMYFIHKRLKKELNYRLGLPVLKYRFQRLIRFFFFKKKKSIPFNIISRFFIGPATHPLQNYWTTRLRFFFSGYNNSKYKSISLKRINSSLDSSKMCGFVSDNPILSLREARLRTKAKFSKVSRRYNFPPGFKFFNKKKSSQIPWFRRKKFNSLGAKKTGPTVFSTFKSQNL